VLEFFCGFEVFSVLDGFLVISITAAFLLRSVLAFISEVSTKGAGLGSGVSVRFFARTLLLQLKGRLF
jgi:hypothetical protein